MEKRTFAMIKPDAVACHYTGQIITLIEKAGFRIIAQKMLRLTTSDTNKFYAVHSQRPFSGTCPFYDLRSGGRDGT